MNKLQINVSGSWRDVLQFSEADRTQVLRAVELLRGVAVSASWCIVHAGGRREWLDRPQ